jgi:hypothetical protein
LFHDLFHECIFSKALNMSETVVCTWDVKFQPVAQGPDRRPVAIRPVSGPHPEAASYALKFFHAVSTGGIEGWFSSLP